MAPQRDSLEMYLKLHRGVMLLQRRMRSLRAQVNFPLDSISAIIVLWIGYKPSLQFGELQRFLKIPKATLSRLLKQLVELGYLKSRTTDGDSRKKQFAYTPKGVKLLAQLNTVNNRLIRVGAYPMTSEQIAEAAEALEKISSGLGAPFDPPREGEEPLFTQIRRLSRISGMVGPNYLGTNHDIMIYHILSELGWSDKPRPLKFFLKSLQMPPSSLSREISKLVSKGWLLKQHSRNDRKLVLLKLTDKGLRYFEQCEEAIAARYKAALQGVPASTIQRWTSTLMTLDGLEPPTIQEAPIFAERCETEPALKRARAFIVEELVRTRRHKNLPNTILPEGQVCISVREADRILAVAFAPREQSGPEALFSHLFLSPEVSMPQLAHEVFSKAIECLRGEPLPMRLEVDTADNAHLSNMPPALPPFPSEFASTAANPLPLLPSAF